MMDAEDVWLRDLFKGQYEEEPYDAMVEDVVMEHLHAKRAIEQKRSKSLQYAKWGAFACMLLVGCYFMLQYFQVMQLPQQDHVHLMYGIVAATIALSMMYIRLVLLRRPPVLDT